MSGYARNGRECLANMKRNYMDTDRKSCEIYNVYTQQRLLSLDVRLTYHKNNNCV